MATTASAGKKPLILKNMSIVPIIFELLGLNSDIELRDKVVKDFIGILQNNADNRIRFLEQPNWQSWLFNLLVHHYKQSPSNSSSTTASSSSDQTTKPMFRDDSAPQSRIPSAAEQRLQSSVTDLVTLLLEHSLFDVTKGATKAFDNTMVRFLCCLSTNLTLSNH